MRKNSFLFHLIILSVLIMTACMNSEKLSSPNTVNKGNLAPTFSLLDADGNTVTLEQFSGKKVYIKFWASWCSDCLAGLKELNDLVNNNSEFEVLTIVSPRYEGEMKKKEFLAWFDTLEYNNIPVLFDENGLWALEFNVLAYPSSYYIGTDGILVKSLVGHQPNEVIQSEMEEVY